MYIYENNQDGLSCVVMWLVWYAFGYTNLVIPFESQFPHEQQHTIR